jgi:hypothetical protein
MEANKIYFFKPLESSRRNMPYQTRLIDSFHKGNNIVVMPAPNKIGKSACSACIVISWCLGYEPWTRMAPNAPNAVEINGEWFRESGLGRMPSKSNPVKIRITGEDWTHSIGQTIVPELKKWAPEGQYSTRKNSQGIEFLWDWNNGAASLELMTHDQDMKLFESWIGDGWWADEPPPHPIWSAMSRGLFMRNGKVLMPTTPLREAWILDELVLAGRPDVAVIDGLNLWDNPLLYDHDMKVLTDAGVPESAATEFFDISIEKGSAAAKRHLTDEISKIEQGVIETEATVGEIYKVLQIERFAADIPDEERRTRLFGEFKSLIGRVLKEYSPDIHDITPFKVPTDWPVTVLLDFHLNKPHAVSFFAVDKKGIHYIIDELWINAKIEDVGDEIIRRKETKGWRIQTASIDPLSKGDTSYLKNRFGDVKDSYTILKNKLAPYGILLEVGSKDKKSGIDNIRTMLRGVNGLPSLYNFNTNEQHRHQLLRWVYEDDKPKKENDDFGENMYRYTLMNIIYTDMQLTTGPLREMDWGIE